MPNNVVPIPDGIKVWASQSTVSAGISNFRIFLWAKDELIQIFSLN